uniref:G_PROTEIN_RECEP_F1_2 domain-containing protein n=1 Tax=Panagrellus redivivus TaxID=6233 RepID=A0A7E4VH14_PANRE
MAPPFDNHKSNQFFEPPKCQPNHTSDNENNPKSTTMWTNLFSLLLSLVVVAFNLIVLLATAVQPRLHTISNTLSCNLWLANCFSGIVGIFHNLFYSTIATGVTTTLGLGRQDNLLLITPSSVSTAVDSNGVNAVMDPSRSAYLHALGPQTLAALFNSTVSLLALLAMAFVQIFAKYQNWMPHSAPVRISACLWTVVTAIIFVIFALVQITRSLSLIIAFQLALLSIFLVINLVIHPVNLFLASRSQHGTYLAKAITQSLWLLLHSLSFTLLAMMLVWESSQNDDTPHTAKENTENAELISLQLAAYTVHCIANPIIAILRDQRLLAAISRLVNTKDTRDRDVDYSLITQQDGTSWLFPAPWIFGHLPPPPPYMSPSTSTVRVPRRRPYRVCRDGSSDSSSEDEDLSETSVQQSSTTDTTPQNAC